MGTFGCFEVTIGFNGNERVDYMTYDTKGIWRCYEIKVSKSDFNSKAKKSFVGHYNYYVMTSELYNNVKNEIPNHIGVYIGDWCKKKPKKQELQVDEQILKDSMIRSLSREYDKFKKTCDIDYLNGLKSNISRLEKEIRDERKDRVWRTHMIREICDKYNLDYQEVRQFTIESC